MEEEGSKTLYLQLKIFLSTIEGLDSSVSRKEFLRSTGLVEGLISEINLVGANSEFFGQLLFIIADRGQTQFVNFLDSVKKRGETDFGNDDKRKLSLLIKAVKEFPEEEWPSAFFGTIEGIMLTSYCVVQISFVSQINEEREDSKDKYQVKIQIDWCHDGITCERKDFREECDFGQLLKQLKEKHNQTDRKQLLKDGELLFNTVFGTGLLKDAWKEIDDIRQKTDLIVRIRFKFNQRSKPLFVLPWESLAREEEFIDHIPAVTISRSILTRELPPIAAVNNSPRTLNILHNVDIDLSALQEVGQFEDFLGKTSDEISEHLEQGAEYDILHIVWSPERNNSLDLEQPSVSLEKYIKKITRHVRQLKLLIITIISDGKQIAHLDFFDLLSKRFFPAVLLIQYDSKYKKKYQESSIDLFKRISNVDRPKSIEEAVSELRYNIADENDNGNFALPLLHINSNAPKIIVKGLPPLIHHKVTSHLNERTTKSKEEITKLEKLIRYYYEPVSELHELFSDLPMTISAGKDEILSATLIVELQTIELKIALLNPHYEEISELKREASQEIKNKLEILQKEKFNNVPHDISKWHSQRQAKLHLHIHDAMNKVQTEMKLDGTKQLSINVEGLWHFLMYWSQFPHLSKLARELVKAISDSQEIDQELGDAIDQLIVSQAVKSSVKLSESMEDNEKALQLGVSLIIRKLMGWAQKIVSEQEDENNIFSLSNKFLQEMRSQQARFQEVQ